MLISFPTVQSWKIKKDSEENKTKTPGRLIYLISESRLNWLQLYHQIPPSQPLLHGFISDKNLEHFEDKAFYTLSF